MRLVHKLSVAFMIATTAILALNGARRVRREVAYFRADRVRDHDLIGRALAASVAEVWQSQGRAQAMRIIDAANAGEGKIRLRWVSLAKPGAEGAHVDAAALARLAPRTTATVIAVGDQGEDERFTYAPVSAGDGSGALELSEGLDAERAFTRRSVFDSVQTTVALGLLTALLSYLLGSWLVGRPVRGLVEKARRLGLRDFGGPVKLTSRDELAELASEMNATGDALIAADARLASETAARIAALEQLQHADRLSTVGKLAAGVAHQLGTPLNVVIARAEMIATGDASADLSRDYARIIAGSARTMTHIIRQLLEFARRRAPRKEQGDVVTVAGHTLDLLRPLAEKQRVQLRLDETGGPHATRLDAGQIRAGSDEPRGQRRAGHAGRREGRRPGDEGAGPPPTRRRRPRGRVDHRPGARQRPGDRTRKPAAHLRAVLHDQGRRLGDRPRALRGVRHRGRPRRLD